MKRILIAAVVFCISVPHMLAQSNLKFETKKDKNPIVYIDGKEYDNAIVELLDQSKIESVNVIKGEKALEEYNAPNGVIFIKTKSASQQNVLVDKAVNTLDSQMDPVIIIDGKVSNKEILSKLSPDNIESMNVLKGQEAINQYEAPNGVIIVKTKK